MQRLAREMNFAETVFLFPPKRGGDVSMRIFTPGEELPFAGHPILGAAFVVGAALGAEAVTLETGAGLVPVSLDRDGDRIVFGRMQQPVPSWEPYAAEGELLDALGVSPPGCRSSSTGTVLPTSTSGLTASRRSLLSSPIWAH